MRRKSIQRMVRAKTRRMVLESKYIKIEKKEGKEKVGEEKKRNISRSR
jgi:hypothetical protein